MRLLMFEDDARYCPLIRHPPTCRWPDSELLSHVWPGGRGIEWLQDFAARPQFATVLFFSDDANDEDAREALELGAHAALSRSKVEHGKLVDALASAASKQVQARADWR